MSDFREVLHGLTKRENKRDRRGDKIVFPEYEQRVDRYPSGLHATNHQIIESSGILSVPGDTVVFSTPSPDQIKGYSR